MQKSQAIYCKFVACFIAKKSDNLLQICHMFYYKKVKQFIANFSYVLLQKSQTIYCKFVKKYCFCNFNSFVFSSTVKFIGTNSLLSVDSLAKISDAVFAFCETTQRTWSSLSHLQHFKKFRMNLFI